MAGETKEGDAEISVSAATKILQIVLPKIFSELTREQRIAIEQALVDDQLPVPKIARVLGENPNGIYYRLRAADYELPARAGKKLPAETCDEIRRLLLETDLSQREIAKQLGVSAHSVYLRAQEMRAEEMATAGEFQPGRESRRCAKHGLVNVWPCVACEAEAAREKI